MKYLLPFDEESKRKLLNLILADSFIKNNNDLRVKVSIMPKWKIFDFKKTLFRYYGFSVALDAFVCG